MKEKITSDTSRVIFSRKNRGNEIFKSKRYGTKMGTISVAFMGLSLIFWTIYLFFQSIFPNIINSQFSIGNFYSLSGLLPLFSLGIFLLFVALSYCFHYLIIYENGVLIRNRIIFIRRKYIEFSQISSVEMGKKRRYFRRRHRPSYIDVLSISTKGGKVYKMDRDRIKSLEIAQISIRDAINE